MILLWIYIYICTKVQPKDYSELNRLQIIMVQSIGIHLIFFPDLYKKGIDQVDLLTDHDKIIAKEYLLIKKNLLTIKPLNYHDHVSDHLYK